MVDGVIAVNDEMGQIEDALPAALKVLRPGGRLAVEDERTDELVRVVAVQENALLEHGAVMEGYRRRAEQAETRVRELRRALDASHLQRPQGEGHASRAPAAKPDAPLPLDIFAMVC